MSIACPEPIFSMFVSALGRTYLMYAAEAPQLFIHPCNHGWHCKCDCVLHKASLSMGQIYSDTSKGSPDDVAQHKEDANALAPLSNSAQQCRWEVISILQVSCCRVRLSGRQHKVHTECGEVWLTVHMRWVGIATACQAFTSCDVGPLLQSRSSAFSTNQLARRNVL